MGIMLDAHWAYKGPVPPGLERDGCGEKVAYSAWAAEAGIISTGQGDR